MAGKNDEGNNHFGKWPCEWNQKVKVNSAVTHIPYFLCPTTIQITLILQMIAAFQASSAKGQNYSSAT